MQELFGLSMNAIMIVLLAIFVAVMATVFLLGLRNRVMLKMGLRPILRRPGQTVLIIVGVMLSTVIISAAFGTGDTLSFSIRNDVLKSLKTIDEIIVPAKAGSEDSFGVAPYMPYQRFEELRAELADNENIDGLAPQVSESVPAVDLTTRLSEGRMNVVGLDAAFMRGFDGFKLPSGEEVVLEDLAQGEAYVNEEAAKELEALAGHDIRLFIEDEPVTLTVRAVVSKGGLAGRDPTLIVPLDRAQAIFGKAGQINTIVISNRGDKTSGAKLSKDVTKDLRVLFNDRGKASQLKELLDRESVLTPLEEKEDTLSEHLKEDVSQLREELKREELSDRLISLLADPDVVGVVLEVLENEEIKEVDRQASTLFEELAELQVFEVKRRFLDEADMAGSIVTSFFLAFSLFSIVVGILLIFLIFVMLASARRSEMGMARAVGAKRRHLVQMFTFEGVAYALGSAAVGVLLGLAVSAGMVVVINNIISSFDEAFQMAIHFEARTIIVSYCLGVVITFATVATSAYRVSRLNIVTAVRGLPETITLKVESTLLARLRMMGEALIRPLLYLWRALRSLLRLRFSNFLRSLGLAVFWAIPPVWAVGVAIALVRFGWPYLLRGWLTLLIGVLVVWWGIAGPERLSIFTGGASLVILGFGLQLRVLALGRRMPAEVFGVLIVLGGVVVLSLGITGANSLTIIIGLVSMIIGVSMVAPLLLGRMERRPEAIERLAFTFIGVVMLVFWSLPSDPFPDVIRDLKGDADMMVPSGIFMVAAAVWTVMYNADLLVRALTFATGRFGKIRPVLVTAVAYPMSAKFRTGLTLAMFSLVIFTLTVMSVLTAIFGSQFTDAETVHAGWEIDGNLNFNTPIDDIRGAIDQLPALRNEDFEAIGGFTGLDAQVRMLEGENQRWDGTHVRFANKEFLEAAEYKLKIVAEGYGTTDEEVWQALIDDPSLAVVGGRVVATSEGATADESDPWLEDVYYEGDKMSPADIEVREPRTGEIIQIKVVGVMDREHEFSRSILTSKALLDDTIPFPVPITHYRFKLPEGVDLSKAAKALESSLLEHGVETVVLQEELDKEAAAGRTFFRMFTGFMALGLLVGVAALGVVSTRAVVERRQQIGVLRAIGYRRRMIQLSFLLEASFVSLLGIFIGTTLGIVLGWQAYNDIKAEEGIESLQFVVPWVQLGVILVVTYGFSLLATFIPSRQAARVYPAEALRYE